MWTGPEIGYFSRFSIVIPQVLDRRLLVLRFVMITIVVAFDAIILNKAEWLGSPVNIKGANKDAKI